MSMTAGQLVMVQRIPPRPEPHSRLGQVGLIDHLTRDRNRAMIVFLNQDGDTDGAIFLPVECLQRVDDPAWQKALAEYQRRQREQEVAAYRQRLKRQQTIELIADKYQVTVDAVLEIAAVVTGEETRHRYY